MKRMDKMSPDELIAARDAGTLPPRAVGDELARRLSEAEAERDRLDSWDGLMLILERHYPSSVFDGSSGDPGARLVVALRELATWKARAEAAEGVVADAIRAVVGGRRGTIGLDQVYTSRIGTKTIERWKATLAARQQDHGRVLREPLSPGEISDIPNDAFGTQQPETGGRGA